MNKIKETILKYESGEIDYEAISSVIFIECDKKISRDELDNYWRSESLDDYVKKICIPAISEWHQIDDLQAIKLIEEIINSLTDDSILCRNSEALEKRYSKPEGTISELIFHKDVVDAERILKELKQENIKLN